MLLKLFRFLCGSNKAIKHHKEIFENGKHRYGTVVGYLGSCARQERSRFNDASEDHIYNGANDDEVSYTAVILLSTKDDGTDEELILESYGTEDGKDVLLSSRFPMDSQVEFYEYNGDCRFAADKWLTK